MTTIEHGEGTRKDQARRAWSIDELRVLAAIYFNSSFSIGDDGRDECRSIADCFNRTPSSIDRQWRNIDAVVKGRGGHIGSLVRKVSADYLAHPSGCKSVALAICREKRWPLESLVMDGAQPPLQSPNLSDEKADLRAAFMNLLDRLKFKVFSSGSQGFFCQGKMQLAEKRFQAQVTAVLVGSKQDLTVSVQARSDDLAWAVAPLIDRLETKRFKTGRTGLFANGKVSVGTERFQITIQAVQIGGS